MARVETRVTFRVPYAWKYEGPISKLSSVLTDLKKQVFAKIVDAYGNVLAEMEKEPNMGLMIEDMKKKKIEVTSASFRKEMHDEARGFLGLLTTKAFPHIEPLLTSGINVWIEEGPGSNCTVYMAAYGPGHFFWEMVLPERVVDFSCADKTLEIAERVDKWSELTSTDGWASRLQYPIFHITEMYLDALALSYDQKHPLTDLKGFI